MALMEFLLSLLLNFSCGSYPPPDEPGARNLCILEPKAMQNGLRFQPRQSGSWACSPPQTHPCSHWALRKCAARTWPPLPAVLPGAAPSGPGPGSQALGDFLTLSSRNDYQCAGAGERSCPLHAWRGSKWHLRQHIICTQLCG